MTEKVVVGEVVEDEEGTGVQTADEQSPVLDGTAFTPRSIATRFVPQFEACARWRF